MAGNENSGRRGIGITQLPSGAYRWRVSAGGIRRSGTATTLDQARRDRLDAELVTTDRTAQAQAITVQELLDMWLAEVDHAANTIDVRDRSIAAIPTAFRSRPVAGVQAPHLAALWREMSKAGTGTHTISRARSSLSAAWQLGVVYGITPTNPVRAAKWNPPTSKRIDPPSPATVRTILERVATPAKHEHSRPQLVAWLRLMATIGARPGELCALRWDGLDPKRSTLLVGPALDRRRGEHDGKNGQPGWRTVTLPLPLATELRRLDRIVGVPWIFQHSGEPWRPEYPSLEFRRACRQLGIDGVRLYDLRHFAATQAIAAGVPIPDVAYMLGDNPATVMRVYAHSTGDGGAAAAVARALDG